MLDIEPYFDIAFSVPDGIKKLREMILTLAMQGKLVPQDPKDQPASELLKNIEEKKKRLLKEGKPQKSKPLAPISKDEIPYELPESWQWARLANISIYIQRGKSPKYSDIKMIPIISQKCVQWSGFDHANVRYIAQESLSDYADERFIRYGDILWNSTGTGTIGRVNLYRNELSEYSHIVADSHVTVVRLHAYLVCEYVLLFLQSPIVQKYIEDKASGTTNQIELNLSTVEAQLIALPPLAEQKRIVAEVEQLMMRCDALEDLKRKRDTKLQEMQLAAIKRLLDSSNTQEAWQFLHTNFDMLCSTRENIAELRKAILELAVMGKVINLHQELIIKSVKLKTICSKIGSGATPSGGKAAYSQSGIPLIRSMNVHFDGFKQDGLAFINEVQANRLNNVIVQEGDVLLNITGASIGRVCIAPASMNGARVNQHVCIIRLCKKVLPQFLFIFLASPQLQKMITEIQVGATREALTKTMVENFQIPFYPFETQLEIIEKVNSLMALCEKLELRIEDHQCLSNSVVDEMVKQATFVSKFTNRLLQLAQKILNEAFDVLVKTRGEYDVSLIEHDLRTVWNTGYKELRPIFIDMAKRDDKYKYVAIRYMETSNSGVGVVSEFQRPLAQHYGMKKFNNLSMEKDRRRLWDLFRKQYCN